MFDPVNTPAASAAVDPLVAKAMRTTGMKFMTAPDGRTGIGCNVMNNCSLMIVPKTGIGASPDQEVWESLRFFEGGQGFRIASGENMHDALTRSFMMPDPVCRVGDELVVVDADVDDLAEAKRTLAEAIDAGVDMRMSA